MIDRSLDRTALDLPQVKEVYHGKVRDVYHLNDGQLVMVASDRISAFDVILPRGIPYKGQVLNQLSWRFLQATTSIAPNWAEACPDPNVLVGKACDPVKVEMVVRGYLAGHAWRTYRDGGRTLCGATMPDGMKENDRFPEPIITPSTKADEGHDEDTTPEEILAHGLATKEEWDTMSGYALALFAEGTRIAQERGLILVDTKYEFGRRDGKILLIDEIHTPDSSRYFYAEGYAERQEQGEHQKQLSKEFVREWLISEGFMGKDGQRVPDMTDEVVAGISARYIELYEKVTGERFVPSPQENVPARIENAVREWVDS